MKVCFFTEPHSLITKIQVYISVSNKKMLPTVNKLLPLDKHRHKADVRMKSDIFQILR